MSTLARNFSDGRDPEEYRTAHMLTWLAWNYPGDVVEAEADIRRALAVDPRMTEWAPWAAVRARGEWLRKEGRCS